MLSLLYFVIDAIELLFRLLRAIIAYAEEAQARADAICCC